MGNAVGTELCGNIIHGFAGAECALWSFVGYTVRAQLSVDGFGFFSQIFFLAVLEDIFM